MHRRDCGRWAVVDLQTMTASLTVNDRSKFGNMLSRRGFDALMRRRRLTLTAPPSGPQTTAPPRCASGACGLTGLH
jgi:hypothetical protein